MRWERPGHGLVAPDRFIGLAEECGLIGSIGAWVLEEAMSDVDRWTRKCLVDEDFTISVNLSQRQLVGQDLGPLVNRLLAGWALPASSLCLEVTESAVAEDPLAAAEVLAELSALGVKVAMDDFGVGVSTLGHIGGTVPIDVLKLDRMFVSSMAQRRERAIVSVVASLARDLGLTSVAEGVEDAEQADALALIGLRPRAGLPLRPAGRARLVRARAPRRRRAAGPVGDRPRGRTRSRPRTCSRSSWISRAVCGMCFSVVGRRFH